jgi:hypothetical protein
MVRNRLNQVSLLFYLINCTFSLNLLLSPFDAIFLGGSVRRYSHNEIMILMTGSYYIAFGVSTVM